MGNCATCCGKTDGNEITTEKNVARANAKGAQNENVYNNDMNPAYPANGKENTQQHHIF